METNKMQEMWIEYDKKISKNTRLNKEILKHILISKSERRFSKLTLKAGVEVLGAMIFLIYFFMKFVSFQPKFSFYFGLTVFFLTLGIPLVGYIRYFFKLYTLSFTDSVLELRRKVNESKIYIDKVKRKANFMTPFTLISTWFILSPDFKNTLLHSFHILSEPIAFIPLIGLVIFFFVRNIKEKTVSESYKKIERELKEIDELERD